MIKRITTPFTEEQALGLHAGDSVLITGTIYTSRDAAHKRLVELIDAGKPLPMDITDGIMFYVGPTPAKPGRAFGSAGPTTSYRMDPYTPKMLEHGLRGMIGKGLRSAEVIDSMEKTHSVYMAAVGGAGALLGMCVTKAEVIAYPDLGAEAVHKLEVVDFPAVVVIDCNRNDLYTSGKAEYLASLNENTGK